MAENIPQLGMVSLALRKQMARRPIPDDEILATLVWAQEVLHAIIVGPLTPEGMAQVLKDGPPLTPDEISILAELGQGEDLIPPANVDEPIDFVPVENEGNELLTPTDITEEGHG